MNEYAEIKGKLADIFLQHLNIEIPAGDTDLFAMGIMDSLALVELLLRLEQTFGARVSVDDLEFDNFRSLDSIARFVAFHSEVETVA
jgi:acyl carrier protein